MNKLIIVILTISLLSSCQPIEYDLVAFPTSEVNYLSDYKISVIDATFAESITLRPEEPNQELVSYNAPNGKQYLNVAVQVTRFVTLEQSVSHLLDEDDFKIKDHLDLEMKPQRFTTVNSLIDFTWKDKEIGPGETPITLCLCFELDDNISFIKNFIVLEIDFFFFSQGVDIPITQRVN